MSTCPTWLYPCVFYLQVSRFHVPLMRYLFFQSILSSLQVLPYLTQHFPLTFEKLNPYVSHVLSYLLTLCCPFTVFFFLLIDKNRSLHSMTLQWNGMNTPTSSSSIQYWPCIATARWVVYQLYYRHPRTIVGCCNCMTPIYMGGASVCATTIMWTTHLFLHIHYPLWFETVA